MPHLIGQRVQQYRILEKLGEGGMGVVYKAEDTKLDRMVALKFLPPALNPEDAEKERFLREAKTASALNHPNVCTIFDIREEDGEQFIVMEFVEGETLKARIRRSRLPIDDVVRIAQQIAEGLLAAHGKGIVHRDIKSDNIMLAGDGRVKIMDFGLAKLLSAGMVERSRSTAGTLSYISPEQIKAEEIGPGADLWSLGVVLYEMLTGQLPFSGDHEAALIYEVLNSDPPSVAVRRPDVPSHLQTLVTSLLQKNRSLRPGSAQEVIDRLRQAPAEPVRQDDRSIAVLYFENMSSDKESDYFCAGMTEDIITDLSKIRELKIISRTDVLPFRHKEVNTREVGETLRVKYILEGSVRKAGNRMRITAQLIAVETGFHVWADRFDRLVEDIFEVQTEVSRKIAEALKVSLTETEEQLLSKPPTRDLRAYDLYMRGRELLYLRGKKNNEAAIRMFENAIALDQQFAAAYAALGEAYSYMYTWYDGDKKWLGKTIEVSRKALALDADSIEAQFSIGTVHFQQKQFDEARQIWERVIKQNPDYYDAHRWLGISADIAGAYDEAHRYYDQCIRLKPYSEEPWMHKYMTYLRQGDQNASTQAKKKLLEVGEQKLKINPNDAILLSRMAAPYADFGDRPRAYAVLKKVLEIDPTDGLAQYNCACTYAVMGDRQEAITCLKNAILWGYKNVKEWIKIDPDLESLRSDPEYQALVAEAANS